MKNKQKPFCYVCKCSKINTAKEKNNEEKLLKI